MWGQSVEEGEGRSWGRGCPRSLVTGVAEQLHGPLHQLCPRPSFQVCGDAGCGHVTESGGLWAEVYNRQGEAPPQNGLAFCTTGNIPNYGFSFRRGP